MTEPSKEALEMAERLELYDDRDTPRVAAALQKLMNEREGAANDRSAWRSKAMAAIQRADTAESKLDSLLGELMEWAAEERASFRRGGEGSLETATECEALVAEYEPKP
jgi:hypothetical protein